ncbi:MAG TPA: ATPase, T2SS/T4P/T4SS family [Planctomycetota bacterium]|nr:ATPase, T2SS/T4P/T4SS family [Planctomycetota bacterium]
MALADKKIGQVMVKEKFLTEEQLLAAYDHQAAKKTSLKEALIDLKMMTEDDMRAAMVSCFGFPMIRLQDYQIDQEAIVKIPEKKCRQYILIPISLINNLITVAIADPFNLMALDDIALISKCEVIPVMSEEKDILTAINQYYTKEKTFQEMLPEQAAPSENLAHLPGASGSGDEIVISTEPVNQGKGAPEIDETPIIKLANHLVATAIRKRASDIHIEPRAKMIGIRYRIDGTLTEQEVLPRSIQSALISRFKIMSKMDISERRLPQDGRIRIVFEGREVDLRVSSLPTRHGEKIVIRILDKGNLNVKMENLNFSAQNLTNIKKALDLPYGMILVTGPTGSGKTTTLYSALGYINSPDLNIITVEDPVEYEMNMINQVQVHQEAGLTFASALKSILRQDPDVVMLGEIRDTETLNIAVKAALTGHMVLSTLHTNDAVSTITRMIDMGGEPFLIASSIQLVVAQRLLRKLCENCKETQPTSPEVAKLFKDAGFSDIPKTVPKARGCNKCMQSGYKGRLAVIEALVITEEIRELIVKSANASVIKEKALATGMTPIRYDALSKVIAGLSPIEEALRETI